LQLTMLNMESTSKLSAPPLSVPQPADTMGSSVLYSNLEGRRWFWWSELAYGGAPPGGGGWGVVGEMEWGTGATPSPCHLSYYRSAVLVGGAHFKFLVKTRSIVNVN
jgi:hypothetical protein